MANIGIVGGGIAGLYCAWKLIDKHSVTLYECQNRLGGRIETHDLNGFKAECGPMRFELKIEPLFSELAEALKIEFEGFPSTHSGSAEFPKYDLQSNEKSTAHMQAEKMLGQDAHSGLMSGMLSYHTSALDLLKCGTRAALAGSSDWASRTGRAPTCPISAGLLSVARCSGSEAVKA